MKQRITYLSPKGSNIDPSNIQLGNDSLTYANSKDAAVEKRITAGLSELPEDLRTALQDVHEIHIRWSSRLNYEAQTPLESRLPSGLHVFFTPRRTDIDVDICPLLKQLFGAELKCHSVIKSFSSPPILSGRFSHASKYQYFYPLTRLLHFQSFLAKHICGQFRGPCVNEAASLSYASYIDVDFDAISHAVTMSGFWRAGLTGDVARSPPKKWKDGDSLEVGVLQAEKPDEPEELKLGGYLTIVGDDEKPGTTLFSFPSRHHPSTGATFTARFQSPTGLHPKLEVSFPRHALSPPKPGSCALHAYLTLPSAIFIDRYQLADSLFLASQNLVALRTLSGEQDLEAPDWVIDRWGSVSLIELNHPLKTEGDVNHAIEGHEQWTATIPLHLRYLSAPPNSTDSQAPLDVPWPTVFWACEAEEGLKMATNPFDRVNLGYDALFGPKTMFYHVSPAPALEDGRAGQLVERLMVPVLQPDAALAGWVQTGTLVVVVVGFLWVLWALVSPRGGQTTGEKAEKKE